MQAQKHTPKQLGFSVIEALLIVLVVAALAGTGYVVFHLHKSSAKNSAATGSTQTTGQQQSTTSTQPQPTAYLDVKEWGVKIPLSSAISDAYYVIPSGMSNDADGLPSGLYLGVKSLNGSCGDASAGNTNISIDKALGAITRVLPTDHDPVSGKLYTQLATSGVTIGNYFYGYNGRTTGKTCASQATLQAIDSAFATAVKGIVPASQTLEIKEWGVHMTLDSTTASLYYLIKPNLPNVAYLSLKTISNISADCAADKTSLGAISRLTTAEQQAALSNPTNGVPGTIQIGNYWFGFSKPQGGCISPAEDAAVQNAQPGFSFAGTLPKAFNTLAADPAAN